MNNESNCLDSKYDIEDNLCEIDHEHSSLCGT